MTKKRNIFRKEYVSKSIRITGRVYGLLILAMFGVVIFDSFKHTLPFYYILYSLLGYTVGYIIFLKQKVVISSNQESLNLDVKIGGKIITIGLLVLRFFAGEIILEKYNVVWATDALYLIFIGVYLAKIRNIFKQIDEQLYSFFYRKKEF